MRLKEYDAVDIEEDDSGGRFVIARIRLVEARSDSNTTAKSGFFCVRSISNPIDLSDNISSSVSVLCFGLNSVPNSGVALDLEKYFYAMYRSIKLQPASNLPLKLDNTIILIQLIS